MGTLFSIIKENIKNKNQMWFLAKMHQKRQYRGSDFGAIWAFVKPTMYIVVFYVAISIGFKHSKDIDGLVCPYFVWLTIGMIAFFYMRDMILNGASCFRRYPALINKAVYPVSTLPTTVAVSYMLIHFGMMCIGFAICFVFGTFPSIYWIQIPFYTALMFIMAVFWNICTGLISAIFKDFYNFLQVVNQAIFWLSAILFDVHRLSPGLQKFMYFNPISYVVEGYRNSVCRHIWFWEEPVKLACYLAVLAGFMILAIIMYKKLLKRVADVL